VSYLIFRAPSEQAGKTWMEAIELSLRCSTALVKTGNNRDALHLIQHKNSSNDDGLPSAALNLGENEIESHFKNHGLF
jgi:oxysterol-binding protein